MDIVVTVPKSFQYAGKKGLAAWAAEGQLPGEPDTGREYFFTIATCPHISPGERVYVVCEGKLRGYAPLVRLDYRGNRRGLVRRGGAVAATIPGKVAGFRGWRYRWWERDEEIPFPDWLTVRGG